MVILDSLSQQLSLFKDTNLATDLALTVLDALRSKYQYHLKLPQNVSIFVHPVPLRMPIFHFSDPFGKQLCLLNHSYFLAPPVSFDSHILFFVSKISHIPPYGCETLYLQTKTLLHEKSQTKQKTPKLQQKIIHFQCHL